MDHLIRNGYLVNEGRTFKSDLLVSDGKIARIAPCGTIDAPGARVLDAEGKYVIPGIIDEHVHFREPGLTQKADIHSESRAAVAGGVTSFMDMPNTVPQTITNQLLEEKFQLAASKSLANYSFYLGATNDNLKEILKVDTSKVCGIKLFMGSSTGDMLVDRDAALETLFREVPCLIAAHCEDEQTIRHNTEHYRALAQTGDVIPDASIHPLVRTSQACLRSSSRAVELAERTGARFHLLHVSTRAELSLLRSDVPLSQKRITAETCPHYLLLDDSRYGDLGFGMKCNPAIKSSDDRMALLDAIGKGLVDTIGTDHAPHLKDEKFTGNYFTSKSGFPSVQHSLELMGSLLNSNGLSLTVLVRLMCHNPAVIYRIDRRGFLREGYHADLAIVDLNTPHFISSDTEFTKCGWTPYEGVSINTKVTHTFVNGNLVYENGLFHDEFRGERLLFNN